MAIRKIVIEGDEVLTKKCRPVEKFDQRLWELLDDMYDTLVEADGCGLAAPQVGIVRRVWVIDIGEGKVELINPEIIEAEGTEFARRLPFLPKSVGCNTSPGKNQSTGTGSQRRVL